MSHHLLLRLPEHPDKPVYWLIWSQEKPDQSSVDEQCAGLTIASGNWSSVAEFIEQFSNTPVSHPPVNHEALSSPLISAMDVTVLVPASKVTLHTLDTQGRLTPTIRQSLPWRLEEELSDDVENLHFALFHYGDNKAHLAVTSKFEMALWQRWLSQAGVQSKRWVPDALMLPEINDKCSLLDIDGLTIARYGQWQIAACEPDWLSLLLDGLRKERPQLEVTEPDLTGSSPLAALAPEASNTTLTLLQGQWQPASPWRQRLLPWRSTAVLGAIFLALMTVNTTLNTRHLAQEAAAYQQQAQGIYQQLFPGERVVSLQSQMKQKLAALQQPEARSQSMLTMLAQITPLLNAFPELKALSMDYDDTQHDLRIQAQANNFDSFSRLRERFEKDLSQSADGGLTITIEALEQTGDKVTGQLVISGGLS